MAIMSDLRGQRANPGDGARVWCGASGQDRREDEGETFGAARASCGEPLEVRPHETRVDPGHGPAPTARKRVLVVDDSVSSAESLALIVTLWGHESRVAFNGEDALQLAQDDPPDVILLDLGLPGMDGFTVARAIREDPRCRATEVLAMTGYREDDDARKAHDLGIAHIFVKPLNLKELEAALKPAVHP
jgi:CheY-like chemotaxis protein